VVSGGLDVGRDRQVVVADDRHVLWDRAAGEPQLPDRSERDQVGVCKEGCELSPAFAQPGGGGAAALEPPVVRLFDERCVVGDARFVERFPIALEPGSARRPVGGADDGCDCAVAVLQQMRRRVVPTLAVVDVDHDPAHPARADRDDRHACIEDGRQVTEFQRHAWAGKQQAFDAPLEHQA